MNELENKSKQNIVAGNLLQKKFLHASSIHCFYYACIQLMKSILMEEHDIEEKEMSNIQRNSHEGFHNWIINYFTKLHRTISLENSTVINQKIQKLKIYRVNADYKNVRITDSQSLKAKTISNEVIKILRKDYGK